MTTATPCDVLLEHLADGSALPPAVATHLAGCVDCQRMTRLTGAARSVAPGVLDPGFSIRTVAGAGATLARRRRTRIAIGTSGGAALAAIGLWLAVPSRASEAQRVEQQAPVAPTAVTSPGAPASAVVAPPTPVTAEQLPAALVDFARAANPRRPLRDPSFRRAAASLSSYSVLLTKGNTP